MQMLLLIYAVLAGTHARESASQDAGHSAWCAAETIQLPSISMIPFGYRLNDAAADHFRVGIALDQAGRLDLAICAFEASVLYASSGNGKAKRMNDLGVARMRFGIQSLKEASRSFSNGLYEKPDDKGILENVEALKRVWNNAPATGRLAEMPTRMQNKQKPIEQPAHMSLQDVPTSTAPLPHPHAKHSALAAYVKGLDWSVVNDDAFEKLRRGNVTGAGEHFTQSMLKRRGLDRQHCENVGCDNDLDVTGNAHGEEFLCMDHVPRHYVEQLEYLTDPERNRTSGAMNDYLKSLLPGYRKLLNEVPSKDNGWIYPRSQWFPLVGSSLNRATYIPSLPPVSHALNPSLDFADIEARFLASKSTILVVDDFLTPEALTTIEKFCLEATVWYHGRGGNVRQGGVSGAYLHMGFNTPALLQVADEIANHFPLMLADSVLSNYWAYKMIHGGQGIGRHADEAALNFNLWITPDRYNLDNSTGGLLLWNKTAPTDWKFDDFQCTGHGKLAKVDCNRQVDSFLSDAQEIRIPYKQNRVVIFDASLFHVTDTFKFKKGYRKRRINVTFLFGRRVREEL